MCGIHGFINGKTKPETNTDDFIKSAFITNTLRGTDSSGIAVVAPNGFHEVAKLPVAGYYLASTRPASQLISRARSVNTAAICHVRAATAGDVTYSNAHPFIIEDEDGNTLVGVHNGTLNNWRSRDTAKGFNVDSAWALSRILGEGSDAFEEISGAYAFVWWESKNPGKLYMARNKDRTLYVAYTEDGNMVYASEAGMIHWLCERHKIKLKGSIKLLEEERLYTFDIEQPTTFTKSGALPKPTTTYTTTTTSYNHDYRTTVAKLDIIFDRIRKDMDKKKDEEEEAAPLVLLPHNKDEDDFVTYAEVTDAGFMGVLGMKGYFTPVGADDKSGSLYGNFVGDEYSGNTYAVMRDVPDDLDWSSGDEYPVKVLGLSDSGNDYIFVVSRPIAVTV